MATIRSTPPRRPSQPRSETRTSYHVGRPWMLDGKMLRGLTGTPMRRIALAKSALAEADPEPFTLANLTTKSLTAERAFGRDCDASALAAGERTALAQVLVGMGDDLPDPARGLGAAPGEVAHLLGDHREAAPLLSRARRFHGGVQREDIGLEGDGLDHPDDVGDALGAGRDEAHAGDHLARDLGALARDERRFSRRLARGPAAVGVLLHGRGELFHGRGGLLEGRGLVLGALRQVHVAGGKRLGGVARGLGAGVRLRDEAAQVAVRVGEGLEENGELTRPEAPAHLLARHGEGARAEGTLVHRGRGAAQDLPRLAGPAG